MKYHLVFIMNRSGNFLFPAEARYIGEGLFGGRGQCHRVTSKSSVSHE